MELILILPIIPFVFIALLYKSCPKDKVLIIFNNNKKEPNYKCIFKKGAIVWPFIQYHRYISLKPIESNIYVENYKTKSEININLQAKFIYATTEHPQVLNNAINSLDWTNENQIRKAAEDIISNYLRLILARQNVEDCRKNRNAFVKDMASEINAELEKIGLQIKNLKIEKITDETNQINYW